jgi:ribonucleotide monophosphatase NagD (HAD superfamily)
MPQNDEIQIIGSTSTSSYMSPIENAMGTRLTQEVQNKVLDCLKILSEGRKKPITLDELNEFRLSQSETLYLNDNDGIFAGTTKEAQRKSKALMFLIKHMVTPNGKVPYGINTNDSRVPEDKKVASFEKMGYEPYDPQQIVLCSRSTARKMADHLKSLNKGNTVVVFGTEGFKQICREEGLNVVEPQKGLKPNAVLFGEVPPPHVPTKEELEPYFRLAAEKGTEVGLANTDLKMPYTDPQTKEKRYVDCVGTYAMPTLLRICEKKKIELQIGGKPNTKMMEQGLDQLLKFFGRDASTITKIIGFGDTLECDGEMLRKAEMMFPGKEVIGIAPVTGNLKEGDILKAPAHQRFHHVVSDLGHEAFDLLTAIGQSKHFSYEQQRTSATHTIEKKSLCERFLNFGKAKDNDNTKGKNTMGKSK